MMLFKLSPITTSDPAWKASIYKGHLIIRAEKEEKARMLAAHKLSIAVSRTSFEQSVESPWTDINLVKCEHFSGEGYSEKGSEEILWPENVS